MLISKEPAAVLNVVKSPRYQSSGHPWNQAAFLPKAMHETTVPAQTIWLSPARPSAAHICCPILPSNQLSTKTSWAGGVLAAEPCDGRSAPAQLELPRPTGFILLQHPFAMLQRSGQACGNGRRESTASGQPGPCCSVPALPGSHCNNGRCQKPSQQNQGLSCQSCSQLSPESRLRLPAHSPHPHAERQPGTSLTAPTAPAAPTAILGLTLALSGGSCSRGAAELGSREAT